MESEYINVAAITPFWRYAVGPSNKNNSAIPFFFRGEAEVFYAQAKRDIPWEGVCLYRRRWFRGIETIKEYRPMEVKDEK